MSFLPWVLAALFAALAGYLALRKAENPYPEALDRLNKEVESGDEIGGSSAEDPPEVTALRLALAQGWMPRRTDTVDPSRSAVRGLVRYLLSAVLPPLRKSGREELEDALNALEDLVFYAHDHDGEEFRTENLASVIQGVTREYALETGISVRYRGPAGALPVSVRPEAFKDALFLLLANAGRFGGGETVDVIAETEDDRVRIKVRDRGPGFTRQALDEAFEPFWTSESDSLGLGLTHARGLLEGQGARVKIGNASEGGGEVTITLQKAR